MTPQMVELRCGVQCGPDGNEVRLNGLPNLRRCRLTMVPRRNSRNGVPVTLDAASLISLKQLQVRGFRRTATSVAHAPCLWIRTRSPQDCGEHLATVQAWTFCTFVEAQELKRAGSTRCDAGSALQDLTLTAEGGIRLTVASTAFAGCASLRNLCLAKAGLDVSVVDALGAIPRHLSCLDLRDNAALDDLSGLGARLLAVG